MLGFGRLDPDAEGGFGPARHASGEFRSASARPLRNRHSRRCAMALRNGHDAAHSAGEAHRWTSFEIGPPQECGWTHAAMS